ncbi:hypothetical protein Ae168Ps1_1250 [Pseudonocardia sp. Ae168_Ps1]|nr:hypothetical protein Ae150APs1_1248 [Pseudonocardia sp. Ae150A_Ps1]OLL78844.1 hypothetical protein Ae168Ps1_1250 [Pseudonocardia sp. Ae168_Ps1]OLL87029.1 hypothetical protein Ae263Ps1_4084c [Pseudonocardia sp. Ae263_Ps1]OLL92940.1 hypothetical protein Ae356Ps1_2837 [Pseudonocardia sp. Ae356_Ps1]
MVRSVIDNAAALSDLLLEEQRLSAVRPASSPRTAKPLFTPRSTSL